MKAQITIKDALAIHAGGKFEPLARAVKAGAVLAVRREGRLYRVKGSQAKALADLIEKTAASVTLEPWDDQEQPAAVAPTSSTSSQTPAAAPAPGAPPRRGRGRQPAGLDAPRAERVSLTLTTTEAGRQLAEARGMSLSELVDHLIHQAAASHA